MKKLLILALLVSSFALAKGKAPPPPPSVRPFVAADLVWSPRGPAALGPDSGPAIEHVLTVPPDLTPECQAGDLTLAFDHVEIQIKCGGTQHKAVARLVTGPTPFAVDRVPTADATQKAVEAVLQARLDAHASTIPLHHPTSQAKPVGNLPPTALQHWQHAADALLADDLSAAITATDLGIAAGPESLTPANRLDAAILAASLGRLDRVKAWLNDAKKSAPEDPDGMAARALLGKSAEALKVAERCVAPEGRPSCDVLPLLRVLVAQRAWREAGHLLEVRIEHRDQSVDDVRLALGVADLAEDPTATLKWALSLTRLRREDPVGWQAAARVHQAHGRLLEALQLLLIAPDAASKQVESLELVVQLLDALVDPLSPQRVDPVGRDGLNRLIAGATSVAGRLAQAVLAGWQGDPLVAQKLAALPDSGTQPVLMALRALALVDARSPDAATLVAQAVQVAPKQPRVAEAALEWAVVQGKQEADALTAYETAERVTSAPDADFRVRRTRTAAQLRAWGLKTPQRWPAW